MKKAFLLFLMMSFVVVLVGTVTYKKGTPVQTHFAFTNIRDAGAACPGSGGDEECALCPLTWGDHNALTTIVTSNNGWCYAPFGFTFRVHSFGVMPSSLMTEDTEDYDIKIMYTTDRTAQVGKTLVLDYADQAVDAVVFLGSAAENTTRGVESTEGPGHARTDPNVVMEAFAFFLNGEASASVIQEAVFYVEYEMVKLPSYFDASPTP